MNTIVLAPGIEIVCASCEDVATLCRSADFVHADPPWAYRNAGVEGAAGDVFGLIDDTAIARHIDAAHDVCRPNGYALVWCTWPKAHEWHDASAAMRWRYLTGAAWGKTGGLGIGFHFRGDSEIAYLYAKGTPKPLRRDVSNLHLSPRTEHSEKPIDFLALCVESFCPPGGLVLDMYAGRAPLARACLRTGRRYLGIECDEARIAQAVDAFRGFHRVWGSAATRADLFGAEAAR